MRSLLPARTSKLNRLELQAYQRGKLVGYQMALVALPFEKQACLVSNPFKTGQGQGRHQFRDWDTLEVHGEAKQELLLPILFEKAKSKPND